VGEVRGVRVTEDVRKPQEIEQLMPFGVEWDSVIVFIKLQWRLFLA
jgi:hypothetical protein